MRWTAFGLLAGCLLSLLRSPAGFSVFEPFVAGAGTRYGVRALALGMLGLAFVGRGALRPTRDVLLVLLGAFAGFALHGLVLAEFLAPASRGALVGWAIAGALGLLALRPRVARGEPDPLEVDPEGRARGVAAGLELTGLALAGTGVAIAVEAVARYTRLLSDGSSRDDTAFALAFLLLTLIGAAAFGGLASLRSLRAALLPVALAATAAAGLLGLRVLGSIASPRGIDRYFRHPLLDVTGIETSRHGTLFYDALIGGSCFVAIAFALGVALSAAARRAQLAALCLGASFGHRLVPRLFDDPTLARALEDARRSPDLVPIGIAVAALGALLVLAARRGMVASRVAAAVLVVALGLLPRWYAPRPQPAAAPWQRVPPVPRLVHETAQGVFTLEGREHGLEALTLGRRYLAPTLAEAVADRERIRVALELCSAVKRGRGELSVLLVGQLTQGRALTLADLGVASVDRSGAWWRAMPRLERDLFGDAPRPAGECIAPDEALRRAERGLYDLVLVPPVPGDLPPSPTDLAEGLNLARPGAPLCVTWLDLSSPAAQLDLGRRGMLGADGFTALSVGLVEGPLPEDGAQPATIPLGEPDLPRAPLAWLLLRAEPRAYEALSRTTERFARAAADGERAGLLAGLAAFYAAQDISSPFADPVDKVELPSEALARLRDKDPAEPLDAFERSVWEGIARLLVGKRWIPEIFETLGPIASAHRPWPALQRALAHASLESFEPGEALAWMEGAPEAEPDVASNWIYRGEALSQLGRPAEATACFARALELVPEHHELERALAMELVRAGDPAGIQRVEALLTDDPDDEALGRFLQRPPPPVEPGFRPHLFQIGRH